MGTFQCRCVRVYEYVHVRMGVFVGTFLQCKCIWLRVY